MRTCVQPAEDDTSSYSSYTTRSDCGSMRNTPRETSFFTKDEEQVEFEEEYLTRGGGLQQTQHDLIRNFIKPDSSIVHNQIQSFSGSQQLPYQSTEGQFQQPAFVHPSLHVAAVNNQREYLYPAPFQYESPPPATSARELCGTSYGTTQSQSPERSIAQPWPNAFVRVDTSLTNRSDVVINRRGKPLVQPRKGMGSANSNERESSRGSSRAESEEIMPTVTRSNAGTVAVSSNASQINGTVQEGGSDGEAGSKMNAEKCRRYRLKRKREQEDLALKAKSLEEERTLLVARIGELQQELQVLRGGGEIDLQLENELLRREVMRHRIFIEGFLKMSEDMPSADEQFRVLGTGLESAVSQIVGLGYTASTWKLGKPFVLGGHPMIFRYQYLPLEVDPSEATRLNISVLAANVPLLAAEFDKAGHTIFADTKHLNTVFQSEDKDPKFGREAEDISLEEMFDNLSIGKEYKPLDDIRFFRVRAGQQRREKAILPKDVIYVAGSKEVQINPYLMLHGNQEGNSQEQGSLRDHNTTGFVSVQSSSSAASVGSIKTPSNLVDDAKLLEAPLLLGHIAWAVPEEPMHCHAMLIGSFPVADQVYKDFSGYRFPEVSEDGRLSEGAIQEFDSHFRKEITPRIMEQIARTQNL